MSMTVPQFAKKIRRSPQAVQQRMRSITDIPDFITRYTSKPHRSRIISDKGIEILLNHSSVKSKGHFERENQAKHDALTGQLRHDLAYTRKLLDHSQKQNDKLNDTIKMMTLTTNNLYERYNTSQKQLQKAQSNAKLLKFKESTEHNNLVQYKKAHKANNIQPHKPSNKTKSIKSSHHGRIYYFFHRHN